MSWVSNISFQMSQIVHVVSILDGPRHLAQFHSNEIKSLVHITVLFVVDLAFDHALAHNPYCETLRT
jgi:hypothetical protein